MKAVVIIFYTFIFVLIPFSLRGEGDSGKVQVLSFDGSTLEGKQMRPSIELVVDPGEVFGEAVFIEPLDLKRIAEKSISESLLEEFE